MKQFEANLAPLKQRADKLIAKRDAAQADVETAQNARQAFMLGGDIDDTAAANKVQARVDTASNALAGFDAAIEALAAQIAEAERAVREERQRIARTEASEKLAKEVAVIESKLAPWIKSTHELAGLLDAHAHFRYECGSVSRFLSNAANEVEIAMGVTLGDLRAAVDAVASGAEPIPRAPASTPVIAPVPKLETQNLFYLRHARYHDASGKQVLVAKFTDHETPAGLVERAIALGVATAAMDDPRRNKYLVQGAPPPNLEWTVCIDESDEQQREAIAQPTQFVVVDRGAPFTLKVSRGPEPVAMAARAADDIEKR